MSAVVVHTTHQSLVSRIAWAAVFCVALNLTAIFLGFEPPIVMTSHLLNELLPPFLHSLQEAIAIIRSAASK